MEKAVNKDLFRFERKYVVDGVTYNKLEQMIKLHPAFFREIFYEREINNIYFDTHDFKSFRDNVDGCAERIKVRIRWYGELFGLIEKPVLEFKIKSALVGRKESFKLPSFTLDRSFTIQTITDLIEKAGLPEWVGKRFADLNPVLLNRYKRKYYQSANKEYRITIDRELEYNSIRRNNNFFLSKFTDPDVTIIELKYSSDSDSYANDISTLFPFRMTKSSKYVNGVDRFFGSTI